MRGLLPLGAQHSTLWGRCAARGASSLATGDGEPWNEFLFYVLSFRIFIP